MRLAAIALAAVTSLAAIAPAPAPAADLPKRILPPPPPVVVIPSDRCHVGRPVEIFVAPEGESNGILPAGMEVIVIEFPFSRREDLWVRIRPPRGELYYGWVYTRELVCL
jgi:hypothetical protein